MLALREVQTRFFDSIAGAAGREAPAGFDRALLGLVQGRGALGPADRLDIYARMYRARLLDVLREDFARVAELLGAERFATVACAYLARCPSRHPSVRYLGDRFPAFLAGSTEIEGRPFLADLARLEWARREVFDAPDAEPLGLAELRAIPPADWPRLAFRVIPAFCTLHAAWPVHEDLSITSVHPAETFLRVWREDFTVYQAGMDGTERVALERVLAGDPFGAVCQALETMSGSENAAREAAQLLLRWVEDGILVLS